MNMKKSIAGVMAGAMAVSAMAAVVSADQSAISLTYDLKTYVNSPNDTKAKVTVVGAYEKVMVPKGATKLVFGCGNAFTANEVLYNDNQTPIGNYVTNPDGTVASAKEWNVGNSQTTDLIDLEFTARPYKNYTGTSVTQGKYQTVKLSEKNKIDGSTQVANIEENGVALVESASSINDWTIGAFNLDGFELGALLGIRKGAVLGASGAESEVIPDDVKADIIAGVKRYGFDDATVKLTYEIPNQVKINNANSWGWTAQVGDIFATLYDGTSFFSDTTMTAELFNKGFNNGGWGRRTITSPQLGAPVTTTVGGFEAGASGDAIIPFKSTLKPGSVTWTWTNTSGKQESVVTRDNDVVAALQSRKAGGNYYTKPVAVINDAIANHDNVTFTFTSYNGYVGTYKSHLYQQWVNEGQGYSYKTSDWDWYNPTFGQHLYTNIGDSYSLFDTDDYDMYGSYSSAWGQNLFTGAVVVNSDLTMQLSDTDKFNWGNNTLTFDWFDIIDEGKITDAKTFLTKMLLYTPVDWYWDSLTVVVSDSEGDVVDAGEGLDGEGELLAEDPIVVEDPVVVETPVVETPVVEAPVVTPVAPAPSPSTGNSSVALAVIPVALAAAAVVAKKRG